MLLELGLNYYKLGIFCFIPENGIKGSRHVDLDPVFGFLYSFLPSLKTFVDSFLKIFIQCFTIECLGLMFCPFDFIKSIRLYIFLICLVYSWSKFHWCVILQFINVMNYFVSARDVLHVSSSCLDRFLWLFINLINRRLYVSTGGFVRKNKIAHFSIAPLRNKISSNFIRT